MRALAESYLALRISHAPEAVETTRYGDRTEIRRIWSHPVSAESIGLYAATQVFVVEREVIATSFGVDSSKELSYAITSMPRLDDLEQNAIAILKVYRDHWGIETGNHQRRDVTYREDQSQIKNKTAARNLSTLKMLSIFLCEIGAHKPDNDRERYLPEFIRSCTINGIDTAIGWITRKYNPLQR